jgi:DNA-binding winged helix-turn-helix (wHTH) protein
MTRQAPEDRGRGTTRVARSVVRFGPYELDAARRTLTRNGAKVPLQARPFDLLLHLIAHRERVVSHDELLDAFWPGVNVTPAALARAVYKARRAVGNAGETHSVIATVHGRGFRFLAPVRIEGGVEGATLGGREPGLARRALDRAIHALDDLRVADPATRLFLHGLARELAGLRVPGRDARWLGPMGSAGSWQRTGAVRRPPP